jgi:hypothetical protein
MAKALGQQIRDIPSETASPETQLHRKYAETALAAGRSWAVRRYSGGRTGTTPPNSIAGGKLFNDSGRFANSLAARATSDGTFTINCAANRLNPSTFTPAAFERMLTQLFELVPGLKTPSQLGEVPGVKAAISAATAKVLTKKSASAAGALADALSESKERVEQLTEAYDEVAEG